MNRRYAQWTDEELKRLAAIGARQRRAASPFSNICRLDCWRSFCEGFEMASPGSVYHPEQEIELMTAALDDAVVPANGQRSSAVKVLSNYE
jgi:hypothetical protein